MAETGYFRGEGSVIWEMDLPLNEAQRDKYTKGYLTRVNADGSTWTPPQDPATESAPETTTEPDADAPAAEPDTAPEAAATPPKTTAAKAEWVGYAVRVGGLAPDDADAMTKADLVDRFGRR